ncbi:hypothetical protein ScPMuIL_011633 [Solemya velum]
MSCHRQYIGGFNFFKEKHIHKVMVNDIDEKSSYCYVRSKCFPPMKDGVYGQFLLLMKEEPFTIARAHYTCPAGLGEGCAHIASLLFALENAATKAQPTEINEISCTSKPCEWSKPSKRQKEPEKVGNIKFKKLSYGRDMHDDKEKNREKRDE